MDTTPSLSADRLLADLAVAYPSASRVFHRYGLDFCCHGRVSVADACEKAGLDPDAVLGDVRSTLATAEADGVRLDERPLEELVKHIVERYHTDHREEVPRLLEMARRVEQVHADKASCPVGLADHLEAVLGAMEEHMQKEEQVLFPMLAGGRGRMAAMPISVMEDEHRDHALDLAKSRRLAHDFVPPADACSTWRALYLGLNEFERLLMEHIHIENNILFPRALRS